MDFDYTPEQERLRKDYRERLEAVMTPERRASVADPHGGRGGGRRLPTRPRRGGTPRRRVADRVRRRRADRAGAVHLRRRGAPGERTAAHDHPEHGRAHAHPVRHRRTEGQVPSGDPQGHGRFRDRVLRTRCGQRSRVATHLRGTRRRRFRDQRVEDVHQRCRVRRLHLAGRAHRSGGQEAQGHHGIHGADRFARATPGSRCTPCRGCPPTTPSTTTSAYPRARSCWARTKAGSWSPTS